MSMLSADLLVYRPRSYGGAVVDVRTREASARGTCSCPAFPSLSPSGAIPTCSSSVSKFQWLGAEESVYNANEESVAP